MAFLSPDLIRAQFSRALSKMYQQEVPLYGDLLALVAEVNQQVLTAQPKLKKQLFQTQELERLNEERHGAIRLGTPEELQTIRRLFAVMGMYPVGYYDLAPSGVPVYSTAFRAIHEEALKISPFRVFCSLLRLELINDEELRERAQDLLNQRSIFTEKTIALIEQNENKGGLNSEDAQQFILEALETFRWHEKATVTSIEYQSLHDQHRLIADVVAFKGPHINHLTPRTLDIDQVQALMPSKGIPPKAIIEGPPARQCPILLRQTSFKALQEKIRFSDQQDNRLVGHHTARFGEIEQRGVALTIKGRALYDELLSNAQQALKNSLDKEGQEHYNKVLTEHFIPFPDSYLELMQQELAYFAYYPTEQGLANAGNFDSNISRATLIEQGAIRYEPIVYEDFLPVSAAGIFHSNLGDKQHSAYHNTSNKNQFEQALGITIIDEFQIYADTSLRSWIQCQKALQLI